MKIVLLVTSALMLCALPAMASDLDQGKATYDSKCAMCHKNGIAGSPKLGDKAAWEKRIAKGDEQMITNSINGFRGESGFMPAKGGHASLSDEEVANAVHYMVSVSK